MTRLICPNCGAQYEVDDDVIPANGRDVQCSNCGHTWFEKPGASLSAEEPEAAVAEEPAPAEDMPEEEETPLETAAEDEAPEEEIAEEKPEAEAEPEEAPEEEPTAEAPSEPEDTEPEDTDADEGFADPAEATTPPAQEPSYTKDIAAMMAGEDLDDTDETESRMTPAPQPAGERPVTPARTKRPALDASVAEILREEAAREEAARRGETSDFETQSDLGLPDPKSEKPTGKEAVTQERIDRLTGSAVAAARAATETETSATRRELLPDIEEINSTLRPETERDDGTYYEEDADEATERRRGFRFGFFTVLIVIGLLWLLYLFAEDIAAAAPATADIMTAYVEAVDRARIWVDLRIQDLLASLQEDGPQAPGAEE